MRRQRDLKYNNDDTHLEIDIPLFRGSLLFMHIETLISEEALLLAKFLRDERKEWTPRLPNVFI